MQETWLDAEAGEVVAVEEMPAAEDAEVGVLGTPQLQQPRLHRKGCAWNLKGMSST
jgi:hypothetical protein